MNKDNSFLIDTVYELLDMPSDNKHTVKNKFRRYHQLYWRIYEESIRKQSNSGYVPESNRIFKSNDIRCHFKNLIKNLKAEIGNSSSDWRSVIALLHIESAFLLVNYLLEGRISNRHLKKIEKIESYISETEEWEVFQASSYCKLNPTRRTQHTDFLSTLGVMAVNANYRYRYYDYQSDQQSLLVMGEYLENLLDRQNDYSTARELLLDVKGNKTSRFFVDYISQRRFVNKHHVVIFYQFFVNLSKFNPDYISKGVAEVEERIFTVSQEVFGIDSTYESDLVEPDYSYQMWFDSLGGYFTYADGVFTGLNLERLDCHKIDQKSQKTFLKEAIDGAEKHIVLIVMNLNDWLFEKQGIYVAIEKAFKRGVTLDITWGMGHKNQGDRDQYGKENKRKFERSQKVINKIYKIASKYNQDLFCDNKMDTHEKHIVTDKLFTMGSYNWATKREQDEFLDSSWWYDIPSKGWEPFRDDFLKRRMNSKEDRWEKVFGSE